MIRSRFPTGGPWRSRTLLAALSVAALAACGRDSTGPTVTRVIVSPGNAMLPAPGATVQFDAQALNGAGKVVGGFPMVWSSSDSSVATISPEGLVVATGAGSTTIEARIAGVAGRGSVTVTDLSALCPAPTAVELAPGGFVAYDASTCLLFDSLSAGARYRVAVTRPVETALASDTTSVWLAVTNLGGGASAALARVAGAPLEGLSAAARSTLRRAEEIGRATAAFEARLRQREVAMVRRLGAATMLPVPRRSALRASAPADLPPTLRFDTATTCTDAGGKVATGVLIHQNPDMAIYQDSVQHLNAPITELDAARITDYYSAYAKGMITAYFGENPDVDGNGKLIVLVSPVVSGDAAGFVWVGNFYPTADCASSNERDMVFLSADLVRAMDDADPSWQALETVAHEAKHVVSLYQRLAASRRVSAPNFQPEWIEEGTAEIAGEMSSRIAWAANGGPPVGATVSLGSFASGGITADNYGVLIHLARTVSYLSSQPNGLVVAPLGAAPKSNVYGSGWHFHRWLADAYGDAATPLADSSLFRALTDSLTLAGVAGLEEETGSTFTELLDQFFAAVCLNGTGAPPAAREFTSYDFPSATRIAPGPSQGAYPWPVTGYQGTGSFDPARYFDSRTYVGPVGPAGVRIHEFVARADGERAQIRVGMEPPGRIVVVRLR